MCSVPKIATHTLTMRARRAVEKSCSVLTAVMIDTIVDFMDESKLWLLGTLEKY